MLTVTLRRAALALLAVAVLVPTACEDVAEPLVERIVLDPATIEFGDTRSAPIEVRNEGGRAAGPVALVSGPVATAAGAVVAGAELRASPDEIPTLNPGAAVSVLLTLELPTNLQPGDYLGSLQVRLGTEPVGVVEISFAVVGPPAPGTVTEVAITAGDSTPRQGDVVVYTAESRDADGQPVEDNTLAWSVVPGTAGFFAADGRFVGYEPGAATVVASASGLTDSLDIVISARNLGGGFDVVGQGAVDSRFTSDIWVHGEHAYTGTWGGVCRSGRCGDRMYVWRITDPANPVLTDSVLVDARTVNDVKVRSDGAIAVLTHEFSADGLHGITLLDLTDPGHPSVIRRLTAGLTSTAGIHNVWIEGDYVYAVLDNVGNGLRIIDISDPDAPHVVAQVPADASFLHDVYVRDGLAFLSQWNDGLVILDVGNGAAGGSPVNPVELGRVRTTGGQTHNAWYWPGGGYVFVGEEDFAPPFGSMHVVDASDPRQPVEVATFRKSGATPHNFWLDEDREILYLAWYENGVVALDVSGELLGELDRQGREIGATRYGSASVCVVGAGACSWAPQLHEGRIYTSDLNTGLWVLEPSF